MPRPVRRGIEWALDSSGATAAGSHTIGISIHLTSCGLTPSEPGELPGLASLSSRWRSGSRRPWLREARLEALRDERTAVQLKSVLALRRRRVQRLLDDHVAPEIQAELVHEIGVFNGLEDELDRLDAGTAVELDGMVIRPARRATAE